MKPEEIALEEWGSKRFGRAWNRSVAATISKEEMLDLIKLGQAAERERCLKVIQSELTRQKKRMPCSDQWGAVFVCEELIEEIQNQEGEE